MLTPSTPAHPRLRRTRVQADRTLSWTNTFSNASDPFVEALDAEAFCSAALGCCAISNAGVVFIMNWIAATKRAARETGRADKGQTPPKAIGHSLRRQIVGPGRRAAMRTAACQPDDAEGDQQQAARTRSGAGSSSP